MISLRSYMIVLALACASCVTTAGNWGFRKQQYTPLLFFTVPKGMIPECDIMERAVRTLEKKAGVRVERLDILRNPEAEAILGLLTQKTPPFLYHRESGQIVHVPTGGSAVDFERLRAWAKGRILSSSSSARWGASGIASRAPKAAQQQQQQEMEEEEDMIENMSLTPTQLEGKQKMKERTKERSK